VEKNGTANGHDKHVAPEEYKPPKQTVDQQTIYLENFTGIRLKARNYFYDQVLSGMDYNVQIQVILL
jgi:hypothetical protein